MNKIVTFILALLLFAGIGGGVYALYRHYNKDAVKPTRETAEFIKVNELQNNDGWEDSPSDFIATYLVFDKDFTDKAVHFVPSSIESEAVSAGIYYTDIDGNVHNFDYIWVQEEEGKQSTYSTIMLLTKGNVPIADGAVFHIVEGTKLGNLLLSEVTLYMVDGNWQTENS